MNQTVIITGASSGIGKALSIYYLSKGWNVVMAARSINKIKEYANQFNSQHYIIQATDVTNQSQCENLIASAIVKFGRIDCLINNAGVSMRAMFDGIDLNVIKTVMDVNFWGTVYCTHAALPYIKEQKGTIVGVSSIAGYRGLPARTGYSASKFAMNGFLEALRTEELKSGINVLTACPGFTASNVRNAALTNDGNSQGSSPRDEKKMMTAEEVAEEIYKAVQKRKRTLVLTNQGKLTVFLNKIIPKNLDKMIYNHLAKEENSPFK